MESAARLLVQFQIRASTGINYPAWEALPVLNGA
jgi:hypothetical protein